MDLTQLANLGEFIGGVAVLVTLIYLAVQVRQTNKTISASAFHGITGHVLALHSLLLQDREMADLTVRGRSGLENLDEVERLRFGLGASAVLHVTNDIFEYYRTGLMKQSQWNNWEHIVAQNFRSQGYRDYWADNAGIYTPGFQTHVSRVIEALQAGGREGSS